MKIKVNDKPHFEITDTQMKVFKFEIPDDIVEDDLKRRLQWIIQEKYNHIYPRFKERGLNLLKENGIKAVPVDDDEFIELVCSQPNYRNRAKRMADGEKD